MHAKAAGKGLVTAGTCVDITGSLHGSTDSWWLVLEGARHLLGNAKIAQVLAGVAVQILADLQRSGLRRQGYHQSAFCVMIASSFSFRSSLLSDWGLAGLHMSMPVGQHNQ